MMYWPVTKDIFKAISIFRSGGHVVQPELNILINFGRRHHEEHFCEIILNSNRWLRRRGQLKIFIIYSSGNLFVQC